MIDIEPLLTAMHAYNSLPSTANDNRLTIIIESDGTERFMTWEQDRQASYPTVESSLFGWKVDGAMERLCAITKLATPLAISPMTEVNVRTRWAIDELLTIIAAEDACSIPSSSD